VAPAELLTSLYGEQHRLCPTPNPQLSLVLSHEREIDLIELEQLCDSVGWSRRPLRRVRKALQHSLLRVGLWRHDPRLPKLVGFARCTGDGVVEATVWDVAVHPLYQGAGLGKQLMVYVLDQLRPATLGRADVGANMTELKPVLSFGLSRPCAFVFAEAQRRTLLIDSGTMQILSFATADVQPTPTVIFRRASGFEPRGAAARRDISVFVAPPRQWSTSDAEHQHHKRAAGAVVVGGVTVVGGAAVVACGPATNATMHANASATVANMWRWFRMERVGFIIGDSSIVRTTATRCRGIHVSGRIARRITGVELGDAIIDPPQSPLCGSRFRVTRHDALCEYRARSWIPG
jgi:GNAT superfamily N-acetyltransferase